MTRRIWHVAIALLVGGSITLAQDAPTQEKEEKPSLEDVKKKEEQQSRAEVAGMPVIKAKSIEEIVQLRVENKDMRLHTPLGATEDSLVSMPGLAGLARVRVQGAGEGKDFVLVQFQLEIRDYTVPNAVAAFSSISYAAGTTTLAQAWETLDDETYSVQLLQNTRPIGEPDSREPRVSLFVQITGEPKTDIRLTADNVLQLRREHPAEVAKFVDPILRSLRQGELLAEVDPKLAWQVFADAYDAPAETIANVEALVAKLNSDAFADRESASKELEALGQPAALVLMKADRTKWTEEQRTRIDAFVAKFKSVADDVARKYRVDRDFLIDCFYSDDKVIQQNALAALRKITGKAIEFDFSAAPGERSHAIARLRESYGTPATQQVKG